MVHWKQIGDGRKEHGKHETSAIYLTSLTPRLYWRFLILVEGKGNRRLLALASKDRLIRILQKMLDEDEFLSDYGIRSWVQESLQYVRHWPHFHILTDFLRSIRINHGVWMSGGRDMKLTTGLVTLALECLEETLIGAVLFGSVHPLVVF